MRKAILRCLLLIFGLLVIIDVNVGRAEESLKSASADASRAIVVQNYYYALPGKAEEVYRWRLHASDVRVRLGLAAGRVLRRAPIVGSEGDSDLPDVIWECEYTDTGARAAEVDRLSKSREFDGVEAHMSTLIRRFSRAIFSIASES